MSLQTMRSGGTAHPEEIVAFPLARIIDESGVFDKASGALLVAEKGAPDMSVQVALGYGFITKSDKSMCYPVRLYSAAESVTITSNGSGNPRIDAIVLYIDLAATPDASVTNVAKLLCVAGSPAPSPAAPSDGAIQTAVGASSPFIRLANVTVASGETAIENAHIEDTRTNAVFTSGFDMSEITLQSLFLNHIDTYSGILDTLTAGEALSEGNVCYVKSDGKMGKADADAEATAPAIAMALAAISNDADGLFILQGTVSNVAWSFTPGGIVYLSTTAGGLTQTAPSGTDDVVQMVGIALTATRIFFDPQLRFIVHT